MDGHIHCAVAYFVTMYWCDVTRLFGALARRLMEGHA
jgi:hypothetical protein